MRGGGSPDGNYGISSYTGDEAVYKRVMARYNKAKYRWNSWTDLWEEIYDYVLPHRESFFQEYAIRLLPPEWKSIYTNAGA